MGPPSSQRVRGVETRLQHRGVDGGGKPGFGFGVREDFAIDIGDAAVAAGVRTLLEGEEATASGEADVKDYTGSRALVGAWRDKVWDEVDTGEECERGVEI